MPIFTSEAIAQDSTFLNSLPIEIPGGIYTHYLKRVMDCVLAAVSLVLCFPLFLLVGICIKLDSQGPVLYTQTRMGKGGKTFTIYKFRTMSTAETAVITNIGKFLRDTKVDELPQLINIIKGDMSIIGPRPLWVRCIRRLHGEGYSASYPGFIPNVRPGLIGLEQVNRDKLGDLEKAYRQRFELNNQYENNLSWHLDFYVFYRSLIQCRTVCIFALASAVSQIVFLVGGWTP
ncbi:MAG: sugar transferase [Candidatus Obscuribacterales bacterium]|nr:sugar transferase [Candidatus Obscuribacterales bacterium]